MTTPLLPNEVWEIVELLLPPPPTIPKGGRPRVPDRACLTARPRIKVRIAGTGIEPKARLGRHRREEGRAHAPGVPQRQPVVKGTRIGDCLARYTVNRSPVRVRLKWTT